MRPKPKMNRFGRSINRASVAKRQISENTAAKRDAKKCQDYLYDAFQLRDVNIDELMKDPREADRLYLACWKFARNSKDNRLYHYNRRVERFEEAVREGRMSQESLDRFKEMEGRGLR